MVCGRECKSLKTNVNIHRRDRICDYGDFSPGVAKVCHLSSLLYNILIEMITEVTPSSGDICPGEDSLTSNIYSQCLYVLMKNGLSHKCSSAVTTAAYQCLGCILHLSENIVTGMD